MDLDGVGSLIIELGEAGLPWRGGMGVEVLYPEMPMKGHATSKVPLQYSGEILSHG